MKLRFFHRVSLALVGGMLCHCGDGESAAPALPGAQVPSSPDPSTPPRGSEISPETPALPSDSEPPSTEGGPTPVGNVTSVAPDPGTGPTPPVEPPTEPVAPATPFDGRFILGADISSIPETVGFGSVFVDTDGV